LSLSGRGRPRISVPGRILAGEGHRNQRAWLDRGAMAVTRGGAVQRAADMARMISGS
jgi:hypothetical protein